MPRAEFFRRFGFLVVPDFLDADCCATIRSEMSASQHVQATYLAQGESTLDRSVRSAAWAEVWPATATAVHDRLLRLKPTVEEHFQLVLSDCHEPQFVVYQQGDFHRPHRDNAADPELPASVRARKVGVVVFVNGEGEGPECYQGGNLAFYGLLDGSPWAAVGFPLVGEAGLLIAFPADVPHEVRPVTGGERSTIVAFFE